MARPKAQSYTLANLYGAITPRICGRRNGVLGSRCTAAILNCSGLLRVHLRHFRLSGWMSAWPPRADIRARRWWSLGPIRPDCFLIARSIAAGIAPKARLPDPQVLVLSAFNSAIRRSVHSDSSIGSPGLYAAVQVVMVRAACRSRRRKSRHRRRIAKLSADVRKIANSSFDPAGAAARVAHPLERQLSPADSPPSIHNYRGEYSASLRYRLATLAANHAVRRSASQRRCITSLP